MTEIDVPDWVVQLAVDEMTRVPPESEGQWFSRDIEEVMRACIIAALGAWVVPVGYVHEQILSDLNDCLAEPSLRAGGTIWSRQGGPFTEALYTLRQEKPE